MSKRFASAILLVALLSFAPVAGAAPADRGDADGLVGVVQAVWEDLALLLGIGDESQPPGPDGAGEPRSVSAQDNAGPHIDP